MAKQNVTIELFYAGQWNTVPVYTRDPIRITRTRPEGTEPTPATATLTLQGFHNPLSPMSPLHGLAGQNTPIRITLPSDTRFYGEVSSWEPRRTVEHNPATGRGDAWTSISAAGILRRIGQGTDPFHTPLTRAMIGDTEGDFKAIAHWAMEDEQDATQFGSSLPGQPAATYTGDVAPAAYAGFAGSLPLPLLTNGEINGTLPVYTDTGLWQLQHTFRIPSTFTGDGDLIIIKMAPGNTVAELRLSYVHAGPNLRLTAYNAAGGVMDTDDNFSSLAYNTDYLASWTDAVLGGDHLVRFVLFDQTGASPVAITSAPDGPGAGVAGMPRTFTARATAATSGWSFGQAALYVDDILSAPSVGPNAQASGGFAGESAADRLARLCREEGIPLTVEGTVSQPMGKQPQETLVALFAESERTDDGTLFEPRDSYGLIYRCGQERYNRPVALVLDYAAKEVGGELVPVLDDLASRNDVTVSRRNGGSARAVLETGRLSVLAPPGGIGRYNTKVDVNTETDNVLPDHAWWHLSKGTIGGVRYTKVTVDLDAKPALTAGAAAVDTGDVIALDNLPEDEATGRVRLMVTGYVEVIGSHRRLITFDCIQAEQYDVGVWASDAPSDGDARWGADDSYLTAAVDDNDTVWLVDPGADVWATSASHPALFPAGGGAGIGIDCSGLSYVCTAIEPGIADAFGRTVSNGWGTADTGQAWSAFGAGGTVSSANFAVAAGVGTHSVPVANANRATYLGALSLTDVDVAVTVTLPVSNITGGSVEPANLLLRGTSLSSYYVARVEITTAEAVLVRLYNPAGTLLASATVAGLVHSSAQALRVRARLVGSSFAIRVWPAAGTEPDVWHATATDATAPGPGWIGVSSGIASGNSNAPLVFSYDNLQVVAPLKLTVTRLAQDKALAAGEQVWVSDTLRWSL